MRTEGRQSPDGTQVPAEVTRKAGGREGVGPGQMALWTQTPKVPWQKQGWARETSTGNESPS